MTASQSGAVRPVPERLHAVTPQLMVARGGVANHLYAQAFGAGEVGERFTGPGGELVNAEIRIGDSVVMVACVMALYREHLLPLVGGEPGQVDLVVVAQERGPL